MPTGRESQPGKTKIIILIKVFWPKWASLKNICLVLFQPKVQGFVENMNNIGLVASLGYPQ